MTESSSFDPQAAHRFFAAECFNHAWTWIDHTERTAEETAHMVSLAHASLWHWSQRTDCTPLNLAIGYWQVARVHTLAQHSAAARHYATLCLHISTELPPFYRACAHEALARAALLTDELELARHHQRLGTTLAAQVEDAEDRAVIQADLQNLALE